jgi:hypothetical protein
MKNKTLITALENLDRDLSISIKAYLQNGAVEKGYGNGEFNGFSFSQDYKIEWNDGYLEASEYDGITVGDVIEVLRKKTLSKIGSEDFELGLGQLMNGNTEYDTSWDDEEPDELPSDSELYSIMDIDGAEYVWVGASSLEFEIIDDSGEIDDTSFILSIDESDDKDSESNSDSTDNTTFEAVDLDATLKEMGYVDDDSEQEVYVRGMPAKKAAKKIRP